MREREEVQALLSVEGWLKRERQMRLTESPRPCPMDVRSKLNEPKVNMPIQFNEENGGKVLVLHIGGSW